MSKENVSQEPRLKNIDETNYFVEEIEQNQRVISIKRFAQL